MRGLGGVDDWYSWAWLRVGYGRWSFRFFKTLKGCYCKSLMGLQTAGS